MSKEDQVKLEELYMKPDDKWNKKDHEFFHDKVMSKILNGEKD